MLQLAPPMLGAREREYSVRKWNQVCHIQLPKNLFVNFAIVF